MTSAIALIPARGGSVEIPNKNIREVGNVPLICWTIRAAIQSGVFQKVYVSSDSDKILEIAQQEGALTHARSQDTSSSTATTESVIVEFLSTNKDHFDIFCLIQATSPFIPPLDLKNAFATLSVSRADSLLSVTTAHKFIWRRDDGEDYIHPLNYDVSQRPRRQDWRGELIENGAFYMIKNEFLNRQTGTRLGKKVIPYEMEAKNSMEIDSFLDLKICNAMLPSTGA